MNRDWRRELGSVEDVDVVLNDPLSRHTTLAVGGRIPVIVYPKSIEALFDILHILERIKVPFFVLGKGSNILVADKLPELVAISLEKATCRVEVFDEENNRIITLGAGVSLCRLMRFCLEKEVAGLEFLVGIPGSVGGAVVMNAGTRSGETSNVFRSATIIEPDRSFQKVEKKDVQFSYRHTELPPGSIVWDVSFCGLQSEKKVIAKEMRRIFLQRKQREPKARGRIGSIFKNPPGDYAGRLIERSGLKGMRMGDAEISPIHANWIMNRGGATAQDIYSLVKLAQRRVREKFGISLVPEIKFIGFD